MRATRARDYVVAKGVETAIVQTISLVVVAALATSRARGGLLAPGFLAALVTGSALAAALMGRAVGQFEAAHDLLAGAVDADAVADGADAFASTRLRRAALGWAVALGVWGGAGGLLVAAALRGQHAPFAVTAVALVAVGACAATVAGVAGRIDGITATRRLLLDPPVPVTLRRRAWRELALPAAVIQLVLNAGFAIVLFHDRTTGDALADRPLTESIARADALVIVTLLTVLFGYWASRWGRVDASLGRVAADPEAVAAVDPKHPLGVQGLVYVAFAGLLVWSFAGWIVPSLPSLTRVAIVRGLFAGLLTFVVVGVAHVRGALNTLAGASPLPPPRTVRPVRVEPAARRRVPVLVRATCWVLALVLVAVASTALAQESDEGAPVESLQAGSRLSAEGDTFVARVEYDIPLPAGTGGIAQVAGRIGAPTVDNAYGLAAAPTRMDAVVGGTWYNPIADEDPVRGGQQPEGPVPIPDENTIPQVECFHPGNDVAVKFAVPGDLRGKLDAAPVLGYATAQCGDGPESEVHARVLEAGGAPTATEAAGPVLLSGPAGADGLFRPDHGELTATASSWGHDLSLLGGIVKIGSVSVEGASVVTGKPGGQRTSARVRIDDVSIAGIEFSIDNDRLVIAGQPVALDSLPARTVLDAAEAALRPFQCALTVLGAVDRYPQGFVLGREEPPIGLHDDGTLAASMAGGLLLVCDMDERLTTPTGFSPQRMQVLVGFVYTSASAIADVGGFGIGDLAGDAPPAGSLPALAPEVAIPGAPSPSVAPAPVTDGGQAAPSPGTPGTAPSVLTIPFRAVAGTFGEWPLWLLALAVWLVFTHAGVRRMQRRLAQVSP